MLGANYPGSKWYERAYKLIRTSSDDRRRSAPRSIRRLQPRRLSRVPLTHARVARRAMLTGLSIRDVVLIEALDLRLRRRASAR